MKKRQVIAFCGCGNSGKDYSAKRLMTTKGFKKVAYADTLRKVAFDTLGIPFEKGMEFYEKLKVTKILNNLTFRNILENLASSIRELDPTFWARSVLAFISKCPDNVCISDLRYVNEFVTLKNYCESNNIELKVVFCDYHGENYDANNPHESAKLANYLKELGYKDQQYVDENDILALGE